MREIAAHAGVSLKTVSRVVNNEAGVTAETQERVRRAIEDLNGMRGAPAPMEGTDPAGRWIGVVLERMGEPFQSAVAESIERVAHARGCFAMVASSHAEPEREAAIVESMMADGAAGLILVPTAGGRYNQMLLARKQTPIVLVDRIVPETGLDTVHADNVGGASEAVSHLIARGHRRIAFLGSETTKNPIRERLQGYRQTLLDNGIPVDPDLIVLRSLREGMIDSALGPLAALAAPPTAIFAASGRYAIEVVRAIHHRQPNVALVGFDDFPLSEIVMGGVTVVSQHPSATGQAAVDTLLQRLGGDVSQARKILIGTDLIVRNSTACPPMALSYPA